MPSLTNSSTYSAEVDRLSERLRADRASLDERVRQGLGGLAAVREYSDLVDTVLRHMLEMACSRVGRGATPAAVPVAIVATGGYGRRELCPRSDVDITFVPHRDGDSLVDRIIKEMFTLVMRVFIDGNGMDVGYAYRLLEDCSNLDHQTACGLLDARRVAGSDRLFIRFEDAYWEGHNSAEFIFAKLEERRKQRSEFGGTPRLIEPHLKNGPGGFRDLQTAVWVTQAAERIYATDVRGDRLWEVLLRHGALLESEAKALQGAKEFLFRVRNALHVATNAERDVLVVTRQEEIADFLGYRPGIDEERDSPAVECFMRDYYAHVADVDRICCQVMRRAENGSLYLGIDLDCVNRTIVPVSAMGETIEPMSMLQACELSHRHDIALSDMLRSRIAALNGCAIAPPDWHAAGEALLRIFGKRKPVAPILQDMADLGVLGWIVPEFQPTFNQIPYDESHDFTVGQHTLNVIRNLDGLLQPPGQDEMREFRMLMPELPRPEALLLAALLHDAGKCISDRPHAEVGEEIAQAVCRRMGWNELVTSEVAFLVRHHLLMSETSRLQDCTLDETVRAFAKVVGEVDRLNMLFLLTYADTAAVGAGVWTQVQARFLKDLYRRTEQMLAGDEPDSDEGVQRARRILLKELAVENLPPEEVAAHVASMPAPYILNTEMKEIGLHIGFVRSARQGTPVVDFYDDRGTTFTEVCVCAMDDPVPGLLSKIAGVLYAADLTVHSAQVFTRVAGTERIAIDTLTVDFRGRQLTSGKRKEVAKHINAVLTGEETIAALLTKRSKPAAIGGSADDLKVRNDLAEHYSVVEVTMANAQSALYRASGAISELGWDIHSARVSMFRGKSVANYYLAGIKHLSDADVLRLLKTTMPACR